MVFMEWPKSHVLGGSWRSSKSQTMKLLQVITLRDNYGGGGGTVEAFIQRAEHDHI